MNSYGSSDLPKFCPQPDSFFNSSRSLSHGVLDALKSAFVYHHPCLTRPLQRYVSKFSTESTFSSAEMTGKLPYFMFYEVLISKFGNECRGVCRSRFTAWPCSKQMIIIEKTVLLKYWYECKVNFSFLKIFKSSNTNEWVLILKFS